MSPMRSSASGVATLSNDIDARDTEAISDTSTDLAVRYAGIPSIQVLGLDGLKERIASVVEMLDGWRVEDMGTAENLKIAKKQRAFLRNIAKSVDQKRKDAKSAYMAPVEEFAATMTETLAPVNDLVGRIDAMVKQAEAAERDRRTHELREHWYEFAGALADAIDYELIADPKWLNKSVNLMTAYEEIQAAASRVAAELETLDGLSLAHPLEAKAEYLATLDLSRAIARDKELTEQEARAAELAATKARYEEAQAQARASETVEAAQRAAAASIAAHEAAAATPAQPVREWCITFTGTRDQALTVAETLKSLGLKGSIR